MATIFSVRYVTVIVLCEQKSTLNNKLFKFEQTIIVN